MSEIPHTYWFNYLTWVEGTQWRGLDYDAAKIVRGLKGESFKGYVEWTVSGKKRRFTNTDIGDLINPILLRLGSEVSKQIDGPACIVPIPNSGMAVGAKGKFRVLDLAEPFAGNFQNARITPVLRWDKPRSKAHQAKGWRTPEMFQPFFRLAGPRPEHPVVIFDDVFTSGSQSIAAARFLREQGCEVVHIATPAKAGRIQVEKPFEWRTEMVEIDYAGLDFDDEL